MANAASGGPSGTEERRGPTVIQAGGGIPGVGVVGSRRRPLSSRISKANRELHAADSYSQVDQFDNADEDDFEDNDRDS